MEIEVFDAQLVDDGQQESWVLAVDITGDDGEVRRLSHQIPADAFEWRAAEYGVDPDDRDTLLDIVLHEPHVAMDGNDPLLVTNTADVDAARRHHLKKIRDRFPKKARGKKGRPEARPIDVPDILVDQAADDVDPLEFVKSGMKLRPAFLDAKREIMSQTRANRRLDQERRRSMAGNARSAAAARTREEREAAELANLNIMRSPRSRGRGTEEG